MTNLATRVTKEDESLVEKFYEFFHPDAQITWFKLHAGPSERNIPIQVLDLETHKSHFIAGASVYKLSYSPWSPHIYPQTGNKAYVQFAAKFELIDYDLLEFCPKMELEFFIYFKIAM